MHFLDALSEMNLDCLISRKMRDHFYSFNDRITICISFFGLDRAAALPPNFVMTGPLIKPPEQMSSQLGDELREFIDNAEREGCPVIYITLGSEVIW